MRYLEGDAVNNVSGVRPYEPPDPTDRSPGPTELCRHSGATASEGNKMMILICYDGSADAQAAIDRAGSLMPGSGATVLMIWETILETMARYGSLGFGFGGDDGEGGADATIEKAALQTAGEGAQRLLPLVSSRTLGSRSGTRASRPRSSEWLVMWTLS